MVKLKPKSLCKKILKDKSKDSERKKKRSNPKKHLKKRIIFKNKLFFKKEKFNPSITRFNINSYFFMILMKSINIYQLLPIKI